MKENMKDGITYDLAMYDLQNNCEQEEEEENAMEMLAKVKLAGDNNSIIYALNEEFAGRVRGPSEE